MALQERAISTDQHNQAPGGFFREMHSRLNMLDKLLLLSTIQQLWIWSPEWVRYQQQQQQHWHDKLKNDKLLRV